MSNLTEQERRKIWDHLDGKPFAFRRFGIKHPLIEGAAYGTEMVERRALSDRRGAAPPEPTLNECGWPGEEASNTPATRQPENLLPT